MEVAANAQPRRARLEVAFDMYHRKIAIMSSLVFPTDAGMDMRLQNIESSLFSQLTCFLRKQGILKLDLKTCG